MRIPGYLPRTEHGISSAWLRTLPVDTPRTDATLPCHGTTGTPLGRTFYGGRRKFFYACHRGSYTRCLRTRLFPPSLYHLHYHCTLLPCCCVLHLLGIPQLVRWLLDNSVGSRRYSPHLCDSSHRTPPHPHAHHFIDTTHPQFTCLVVAVGCPFAVCYCNYHFHSCYY